MRTGFFLAASCAALLAGCAGPTHPTAPPVAREAALRIHAAAQAIRRARARGVLWTATPRLFRRAARADAAGRFVAAVRLADAALAQCRLAEHQYQKDRTVQPFYPPAYRVAPAQPITAAGS